MPSSLRPLADGADKLTARGRNVRELIDDLESRFPGMRAALIENGELVLHFAVSVDDVVSAEGLETRQRAVDYQSRRPVRITAQIEHGMQTIDVPFGDNL